MFKCLLLRNYKYDQSQTVHECSLDGPLQTLRFLFRYEIQTVHGSLEHATAVGKMVLTNMIKAKLNIEPYGEKGLVSKRWTIETKLPRNDHWKVLYRIFVLYMKSKMAATAGH